jgi:hypothetical protein
MRIGGGVGGTGREAAVLADAGTVCAMVSLVVEPAGGRVTGRNSLSLQGGLDRRVNARHAVDGSGSMFDESGSMVDESGSMVDESASLGGRGFRRAPSSNRPVGG